MAEIWTMGETLVEIMRTEVDKPLNETGLFSGPYPSGSSAIMISTVARMGHSCGIISGVGKDGFGECMLNRLKKDGVDVSKVLVDPDGSTACAFVAYDSEGDRRYLFHWDETPATKAVMPDVTEPSLKEAKYFHVMGCALTAKLSYGWEIVKTARAMKAQGTKISFDPNVRTEHLTNPNKSKECFEIINAMLEITNLFAPGLDPFVQPLVRLGIGLTLAGAAGLEAVEAAALAVLLDVDLPAAIFVRPDRRVGASAHIQNLLWVWFDRPRPKRYNRIVTAAR